MCVRAVTCERERAPPSSIIFLLLSLSLKRTKVGLRYLKPLRPCLMFSAECSISSATQRLPMIDRKTVRKVGIHVHQRECSYVRVRVRFRVSPRACPALPPSLNVLWCSLWFGCSPRLKGETASLGIALLISPDRRERDRRAEEGLSE